MVNLRNLVIGVGIFSLVVFLIQSILFVFYITISRKNVSGSNEQSNSQMYLLTRVNEDTREQQVGFVKIFNDISEEDFVSYRNGDGDHFLITNFDADRYECTGTCYCSDSHWRRSSSTFSAASRPVFYLVAAVSSLIAYELADNYFEEECTNTFSDTCEGQITSEVAVCAQVVGDAQQRQSAHANAKKANFVKRSMECYGECVEMLYTDGSITKISNKFFDNVESVNSQLSLEDAIELQKDTKEYGCKKLTLQETFPMDFNALMLMQVKKNPILKKSFYLGAERQFINDHLNKFCAKNSLKVVRRSMEVAFGTNEVPMCSGHIDQLLKNPSVKCVDKGNYETPE